MSLITVKFVKLNPEAIPFKYIREGDACMDMYALHDARLFPHSATLIHTGIAIELPLGTEGIVRGRSGLATRGILAHTGTIDRTYRGDVGVILVNITDEVYFIKKHDRIAQFTVKKSYQVQLVKVPELSETERGTNGYGSSGA